MVKKCFLLLAAFLILLLGGCVNPAGTSAGKIIPPPGQTSPFGGKWAVLEELGTNGKTGEAEQPWVGSSVQFAESAVAFNGQVWDKLSYKIKKVDAVDYLMTKYISPTDLTAEESREVDVVTVYAAGNFLGEFMKIDDTTMIFFVQNKELFLKKVSDQADVLLGSTIENEQDLNQNSDERTSGVLLGLRIPAGTGYSYQTLWIAADNHQMHPLLAAEQLFFPRTSGFWELSVREISSGKEKGSILSARNVTTKTLETENADGKAAEDDGTDSTVKAIHYIGNDYVAIEKNIAGVNKLQVLPVDKLSSPAEIKISDLLGEKGVHSFLSAREQAAKALQEKGIRSIDRDDSGKNFGLVRKNGHWFLVGRINYQSDGTFAQTDFDLKIIPPANLIYYDTLALSWHTIKDRVPDAVDAFASPNKDIILVKTRNKLTVYKIGTEQLTENPLAELDLPEGAAVIMAEWATGSYVGSWEDSFLSYGAQALSGSSLRIY